MSLTNCFKSYQYNSSKKGLYTHAFFLIHLKFSNRENASGSGSVCLSDEVVTSPERGSEAQQWRLSEASQRMMVARVTLTLCAALMSLAAANLEFKHHNNTELAAILQQVRQFGL